MTTMAAPGGARARDYLSTRSGLLSWLTTTDHKRIGILYMIGVLVFFLFTAA